MLIPHLVDVPLAENLDTYSAKDDPLTTFQSIFTRFRRKRHLAHRRNDWIDKRSEEIWQSVKDLFIDLTG